MLPFSKLKAMLSSTTITSTFVRFIPKAKANGHNFNYSFSSSFSSIQLQYPPLEHQWSGLDNWRHGPLNRNRFWGPNGPIQDLNQSGTDTGMGTDPSLVLLSSCSSLAEMGAVVLSTADPLTKSKLSHFAYDKWRREGLPIGVSQAPPRPARPLKPQLLATIRGEDSIIVVDWEKHTQLSSDGQASKLQIEARKELQPSCSAKYLISGSCIPEVSPKEIPPPKTSGLPLNAYMLHNLAHVELNAVDLAWDTVVRFSPYSELLGEGFFADFSHVADDESRHFSWCSQRLAELGFSYGDMPAHNFLWRECEKSSDNITARLAVIPLVQEARGLDAGPRLVKKLIGFGDHRTSNIVAKIADEEVAHVAVGVYWFVSVCQKMGRAPSSTFKDMLEEYNVELKGPFNYSARDEAGIPRQWYDPSSAKKDEENNKLSEVYDRLACIISMEQENSSLGRTPK